MREERLKQAVKEISQQPGYARVDRICKEALQKDTAAGYEAALHEIKKGPIMYLNTETSIKKGLKE